GIAAHSPRRTWQPRRRPVHPHAAHRATMTRLPMRLLAPVLAFLALLSTAVQAADDRYTFVMVHGATAGGWEWKRTGEFLTADGHTVYRATLTGLGEREHLNSPEIDLDTHIQDVVNLILFEDLHDVVLTGHSYGGMVITGVMDRIPERLKHVVFLDAAVPADKHSVKCFSQPVSYRNPAALALPVTYVAFVPADQSVEERAKKDRSWQNAQARGWTIRTFPGGHVAQQEDPRGVASLIADSVGDRNRR